MTEAELQAHKDEWVKKISADLAEMMFDCCVLLSEPASERDGRADGSEPFVEPMARRAENLPKKWRLEAKLEKQRYRDSRLASYDLYPQSIKVLDRLKAKFPRKREERAKLYGVSTSTLSNFQHHPERVSASLLHSIMTDIFEEEQEEEQKLKQLDRA